MAKTLFPPAIDVAAERCARARFSGSDCHRCVDVCPAAAVQVDARGVRVDALLCDGCGLCQGACWSAVFSLRGSPSVPGLAPVATAAGAPLSGVTRLTCSGGAKDGLTCLGALDPGRLAEAAAGRELLLSPGRSCTGCHWSKGRELAQTNLEVARRSLTAMGIPGEIRWAEPVEQEEPAELGEPVESVEPAPSAPQPPDHPIDRRELFRGMTGSLARAAAQTLPAGEQDWPDVGQRLRRLADRWHGTSPGAGKDNIGQ
ncbi:MAG: hypothetical protein ACYC5Y_09570 [Symbiobacteriia bacterium]